MRASRPAGSALSTSCTANERVLFVKQGYVMLRRRNGDGEILRAPGALVGFELLDARAVPFTTAALTDVEICELGAREFKAFAGAHPLALLGPLAAELALRDEEAGYQSGPAASRIVRFLLARLERGGGAFPLPLTQDQLARLLALRAETLSRVLKRLRNVGALTPGPGIFVADEQLLASLAHGPNAAVTPEGDAR